MIRTLCFFTALALPAQAETVVAIKTISANSMIKMDDITIIDQSIVGGESDPALFVGMEARVALYAGRAISISDVGLPAIVERNQRLPLVFRGGGITIRTDGRSLTRAGPGDSVRVMNLASRTTVFAILGDDGVAYVGEIDG